jgi:Xaa-Pro aminopeptidase
MKQIQNSLSLLRTSMKNEGVSACIIFGTDPHASEYIADYWKERVWISGFDGSAGTIVVTLESAGLWTDSRYFLQATEQLQGTGIELMKQGQADTLDIVPWIITQLKTGERVGVNPQMISMNAYSKMKTELQDVDIELISVDLIAPVWTNRPHLPQTPFYEFNVEFAGESSSDKLKRLRAEMKKLHVDSFVVSALDDIAWLFNIRGNDVNYNPVVIAYALVQCDNVTLFVSPIKLTPPTILYLKNEGVQIANYQDVYASIKQITTSNSVLVDGTKLNQSLFESIPTDCKIINTMSPIFKLKSVKNSIEIAGVKNAMLKDGVALTRFFIWLEANLKNENLTEISISEKLCEFRSDQSNFVGESFGTIAGYAAHGAIVHYSATPESDAVLKSENILLLDSGGQYLDGTTDITRTVALGKPTTQQQTDFTLVLKGHIALATAIFPLGTRGSQLDVLARKALWESGLNYGHGTGHGVGHFLCVHEGPQSIRMDENPTILQSGMIISNEPGMYRTNEYGIRIENLVHVVPATITDFGQFLQFETLTLFPIDRNLIEIMLLTEEEGNWIDNYHTKVLESLSPFLTESEIVWLENKCKPIYDLIF